MGRALQHNAQFAVKFALLIFTIFSHYEISIRHIYFAYYEGKEPSSSDRVPTVKGVLIKIKKNNKTTKASAKTHQMIASII